jgi:hypothetical protein
MFITNMSLKTEVLHQAAAHVASLQVCASINRLPISITTSLPHLQRLIKISVSSPFWEMTHHSSIDFFKHPSIEVNAINYFYVDKSEFKRTFLPPSTIISGGIRTHNLEMTR